MKGCLEYKDHPGHPGEEHRILEVGSAGGDYYFKIVDRRRGKSVHFRYCISGGFELSHPKTTAAIAALHRAINSET